MVGHYLNTLSEVEENRVLTSKLGYAPLWQSGQCRCLVGAAADVYGPNADMHHAMTRQVWQPRDGSSFSVGYRYDRLALRFGERLNIAIRNRILANRARRLLAQPAREEVMV